MRYAVVVACWALMLSVLMAPAEACSSIKYNDDGRYIGGDLVTQIARKADTIQIMRATARHTVTRTYALGEWYLNYGNADLPKWQPEYVDEFVYELTVVETLKGSASPADDVLYEQHPRILAYGANETRRDRAAAGVPVEGVFNALPEGIFDRPGHNGYPFRRAQERNEIFGNCQSPYVIDVGQTFIALRDTSGRFRPLPIDVEFVTKADGPKRFTIDMQLLVPIIGDQDVFLVRLRSALAGKDR